MTLKASPCVAISMRLKRRSQATSKKAKSLPSHHNQAYLPFYLISRLFFYWSIAVDNIHFGNAVMLDFKRSWEDGHVDWKPTIDKIRTKRQRPKNGIPKHPVPPKPEFRPQPQPATIPTPRRQKVFRERKLSRRRVVEAEPPRGSRRRPASSYGRKLSQSRVLRRTPRRQKVRQNKMYLLA